MKICVLANRYRVDHFRQLVAGLIAAGHDVFYWIDTADSDPGAAAIKRTILDHRFDLGISADWCFFGDPFSPVNKLLPGQPPFINLCFNSPFDALLELSVHDDIAGFLRANRIRLGLLSPADHADLADFGIDDAIDLPCAIGDVALSYGADARLFPLGFMPAATHRAHLVAYDDLLERQRGVFAAAGAAVEPADLLYLGTAQLLVDDHFPTFCFGQLTPDLPQGLSWYADRFAAAAGFAADRSRAERDRTIAGFLDGFAEMRRPEPTARLWRRRLTAVLERGHRLAVRRHFCAELKARYGARFQLFGEDWAQFGLAAQPSDTRLLHLRYRDAAVSLDFGSLSYDTAWFPRAADIVQDRGLLLQSVQADSADAFGALAGASTFADIDGLIARAEALLADPGQRQALAARQRRHFSERYGLAQVLGRGLRAVLGRPEFP